VITPSGDIATIASSSALMIAPRSRRFAGMGISAGLEPAPLCGRASRMVVHHRTIA
jgi:hypothetical protein